MWSSTKKFSTLGRLHYIVWFNAGCLKPCKICLYLPTSCRIVKGERGGETTTTTQISNKKSCKFSSLWAVFMTIGQLCTSIETPMRHNRQEISNLFGKKKWWESMLLASLISGFSVFEIRPENHQKLPNDDMVEMKKFLVPFTFIQPISRFRFRLSYYY